MTRDNGGGPCRQGGPRGQAGLRLLPRRSPPHSLQLWKTPRLPSPSTTPATYSRRAASWLEVASLGGGEVCSCHPGLIWKRWLRMPSCYPSPRSPSLLSLQGFSSGPLSEEAPHPPRTGLERSWGTLQRLLCPPVAVVAARRECGEGGFFRRSISKLSNQQISLESVPSPGGIAGS